MATTTCTWNSSGGVSKIQIDHLVISSKCRSSLLDVRNCRGVDIDNDHHMVIVEVRLKVAVARVMGGTGKMGRRFDVSNKAFQLELRNRFSVLEDATDSLDEEWKHIKRAYT